MKKMKYTVAALFLGAFLITSPAFATANPPDVTKENSDVSAQSVTPQEDEVDIEDLKKKMAVARKEVVARVNGVDINMFDLLGMMNRVHAAYYAHVKEPTAEITREIKQRALDRLIFDELAVQEAVKQGIEPKPEDVEKVINELKSAYGSKEKYQEYLDGLGLTEDGMRERIVRSRRLEGITGREVYQKLIRDEDVFKDAYDDYKEAGTLRKADDFMVKEILVMVGESEEATRARAEELAAELKALDNNFGKLVLDGTFIVRRIPITTKKYPVVYAKMLEMEVGDFSGVVEDNGTYHIFEVLKNDLARDMTEEEARGFIEDRLAPYFQEKRRDQWKEELREGAKVEILLKGLYTDPQKVDAKSDK